MNSLIEMIVLLYMRLFTTYGAFGAGESLWVTWFASSAAFPTDVFVDSYTGHHVCAAALVFHVVLCVLGGAFRIGASEGTSPHPITEFTLILRHILAHGIDWRFETENKSRAATS